MRRRFRAIALLLALLIGVPVAVAHADGDPGSDVLVFQNLFVGADAGLTVAQQAQFGQLLSSADRAGFPIRVAIIASPADLGAVTALWNKPRAYASFLGIELSLAYKQRLLVVMPGGFGFNWPGHSVTPVYGELANVPIRPGGAGLLNGARSAVQALAGADGIKLGSPSPARSQPATATRAGSGSTATAAGRSTDDSVAIIAAALAAIAALAAGTRVAVLRRGSNRPKRARSRSRATWTRGWAPPRWGIRGVSLAGAIAAGTLVVVLVGLGGSGVTQGQALATNPYLDPGTPLAKLAPDFTLSDQFGQPVSLSSFRGKVVMLAFTDSECTTICPMTTTAMLDAKAMLGAAGSQVQLLGVDANPASTSLEDVWSYSDLHGMLHQWRFLTGSLKQLQRVWTAYAVEADIEHGLIAHTPALFLITPQGREAKVYITQQSYASIGQFGQVLAQEASSLLPGRPRVHSELSYAPIQPISPTATVSIPRSGGGTIGLGPSHSPRLYMFFSTWDQEVTSLAGQLLGLDSYEHSAAASGLPAVTAIDEGSVEPSPGALPAFLDRLPHALSYPVGIDQSGRVADGYEAQGVPWFVLVSATGRILWYWEVSTSGWPSSRALSRQVRAALARASGPANESAVERELAGAPAPLAALHEQAGSLLGDEPALAARIRALRGYPIVLNAWASWCGPCRSEFGLFAAASARYGRQVAFLGADTDDSAADARTFLAQHPVSYPSYETSTSGLGWLAVIEGLPTTVFINRAGKVVYVHTGQYDAEGTLDQDISSHALSG